MRHNHNSGTATAPHGMLPTGRGSTAQPSLLDCEICVAVGTGEAVAVGTGELVGVGTVKVSATMTMPGMAPMFGSGDVQRSDQPGRYTVASDLGMAGTWRSTVGWDGPAGRGSVALSGTVL